MQLYLFFSPARASAVGCFRQAKVRISTYIFFLNVIHSEGAVETQYLSRLLLCEVQCAWVEWTTLVCTHYMGTGGIWPVLRCSCQPQCHGDSCWHRWHAQRLWAQME